MNTLFCSAVLDAEQKAQSGKQQTQYVLGMLGRTLLVFAGLGSGAALGLIGGIWFGLIPFAC